MSGVNLDKRASRRSTGIVTPPPRYFTGSAGGSKVNDVLKDIADQARTVVSPERPPHFFVKLAREKIFKDMNLLSYHR